MKMRRFCWTGTAGLWECRTSCIIYERRLILRLNICWFVKSTNGRSRSRPDVSERLAPNPPAHLIDENIPRATRMARRRRRRRRRGGERGGMKVSFQERRLFISVCFSLCAFSPQTANERVTRDGDAHSTHVLYETTGQSIKKTHSFRFRSPIWSCGYGISAVTMWTSALLCYFKVQVHLYSTLKNHFKH